MAECMADDVPPLEDICSGGLEDDDSDGWEEMETNKEQTICLFCSKQFLTIAVALNHCRSEHNFDLLKLKEKFNMDCYSYIKMINYIRLQKPDPKLLTDSSIPMWDDDIYLKTGEMEPWLMYDFDDLGSAPSTPHYEMEGKRPMSSLNFSDMQIQIQDLKYQLKHTEFLLQNAVRDIEKMKKVTRTIIDSGDSELQKTPPKVCSASEAYDGEYFHSYSHFGIHHEMLNDKVRTEGYRDAMLNNKDSFKDKIVLDVGCGTSILSMFAAKAGAALVFAVDQSEVVYKAMDIVRENNLQDTVQLIKGRLEDIDLPEEKVDIIVSEWMGYFLLFEGMLDSFIFARNKYLKPGGLILPNRCNISISGCSDIERYDNVVKFWDNVYEFSMKCMKEDVIKEAFIETVPPEKIITNTVIVTDIDLMTCDTNACEFTSNFQLSSTEDAVLTALVGHFDIFFELPNKVEFSTGPFSTKTHWQQAVFFLRDAVEIKKDVPLNCQIICSRHKKNVRGLSVSFKIGENKYNYVLD